MACTYTHHCECVICEAADSTMANPCNDRTWYDSLATLITDELRYRDAKEFAHDAKMSKPLVTLFRDYGYDGLETWLYDHKEDTLETKIIEFSNEIMK